MPEKPPASYAEWSRKVSKRSYESIPLTKEESVDMSGSLRQLYQFCDRTDYWLISMGIIFTIAFSILPVFVIVKIGEVINAMSDFGADGEKFYDEGRGIAIVQFMLGVITILTSWVAVALFIKLGNNIGIKWKSIYFNVVVNRPISWFDKKNAAELGSTLDMECDSIEHSSGEKIMLIISAVVFFFSCWVLAVIINVQLTLIACTMLPIQLAAAITIEKVSFKATEESQRKYQVAGGIAEESIEGVKTIASCNAQDMRARAYQSELEPLKRSTTLMGCMQGLGWSVFFSVMFSFSGVLFYIGANFLDNGTENWLSGEAPEEQDIVMVFFATAMSAFYLGTAVPCLQYINKGKTAAAKIDRILRRTVKYDGTRIATTLNGEIRFKDVQFSYPTNRGLKILQGVNFKLDPGLSLAIVGETGCGKSTIVQLIQGFYYADYGQVSIDGVDIREYDLNSLREFIGLVSQEPILFSTTIRENIRMGRLEATDAEIAIAAREAEAEYIDQLECGYDTFVGLKGGQLSGGQKQRIAIARALIKKPKILLLDEATSALDMQTEKRIQGTLDRVMQGKTTVIVAQRLSTIKHANSIIVMQKGVVIENGTHQDLIDQQGAYHRLLSVQKKISSESKKSLQSLRSQGKLKSEEEENKAIEEVDTEVKDGEGGAMMKRIIGMTTKYWKWLLVAVFCAAISGLLFPFFGYLFATNIDTLLEAGPDMIDDIKENMYLLIVEACIILFTMTILCLSLARVAALFTYDLRYQGLKSLLFYDQKFFDQKENNPASLAYRLGSDSEKITNIGGPILGIQCLVFASLIGGISISMSYDVILALVILSLVPFIVVSNAKGEILQVEGLGQNNLKETTAIASDSLTNIRTVHAFNRQNFFHQQYVEMTLNENKSVMKKAHGNGLMFGFRYLVLYLMWGTLAWFGAYRVKENECDINTVLVVFFCIVFSSWGFMIVGALVPDVDGGIKSAKNLFKMIDYVPEVNGQDETGLQTPLMGSILFKDVIFKYEGRSNIVLNNVNFECKPNSTLGITGTTGSGKSTIAQLLLRFYNPSSGNIYIDDRDIQDYNIGHLRNSIVWVGQEPILFKGDLMYNMRVAKADVTEEEASSAITTAQGIDILNLYGLHTDVGLRGSKLSGGQKQRVAIARALLRKPKVLVLDESTSALDNVTESNLQAKLKEEEFTVIAIAHRLKTIKDFDKIILLQSGTIIEEGTHNELMNIHNGAYRNLYNTSE